MDVLFTSAWMCSSLRSLQYGCAFHFGLGVLFTSALRFKVVWTCSSLQCGIVVLLALVRYGGDLRFSVGVRYGRALRFSVGVWYGRALRLSVYGHALRFSVVWACSSLYCVRYGRALRFSVVCPGFSALLTPVQSVFSGTVLCVDVFFVWPWATAAVCMCFRRLPLWLQGGVRGRVLLAFKVVAVVVDVNVDTKCGRKKVISTW